MGKRGASMFDALVVNNEISKITNGEFTDVYYFSGRWYLCRYEGDDRITDEKPFCFGFALTSMEHDKSTSYPLIGTILFDEFITRAGYLPDEFVLFLNTLSTIIRSKTEINEEKIQIFMCGNSINMYCPYFAEMGLKHIKDMERGKIDLYNYGDSNLKVAVEFTIPTNKGKPSDKYFAFDNPKLKMISSGAWEIGIYPHCPTKIKPKEIIFTYYIMFDTDVLECNVVRTDEMYFTFIHRKTSPLEERPKDLIYSTQFDARPNWVE